MADYLSQFTGSEIDARLAKVPQLETGKQDKLTSGTNIKTINGQSVLGSGNLQIQTGETDVVKYTAQTLTEEQKAQARANIDAASLEDINSMDFVTAASLPTASASTMGHIYLIGPDANDNYDRYFTQEDGSSYSWVSLGSTQIDLSTYATKAEVTQLEAKVTELDTEADNLSEATGLTPKTINLFDAQTAEITHLIYSGASIAVGSNNVQSYIVEVKPNTIVTVDQKTTGNRFNICSTTELPAAGVVPVREAQDNSATSLSISLGSTEKYILIYVNTSATPVDVSNLRVYYGTVFVQKSTTLLEREIDGEKFRPGWIIESSSIVDYPIVWKNGEKWLFHNLSTTDYQIALYKTTDKAVSGRKIVSLFAGEDTEVVLDDDYLVLSTYDATSKKFSVVQNPYILKMVDEIGLNSARITTEKFRRGWTIEESTIVDFPVIFKSGETWRFTNLLSSAYQIAAYKTANKAVEGRLMISVPASGFSDVTFSDDYVILSTFESVIPKKFYINWFDTNEVTKLEPTWTEESTLPPLKIFDSIVDTVSQGFITPDGSVNTTSANYIRSDYIPVKPGHNYRLTLDGMICEFDANKVAISGGGFQGDGDLVDVDITTKNNTSYVVVSGRVAGPYIENAGYFKFYDMSPDYIIPSDFRHWKPLNGKRVVVFGDSIVGNIRAGWPLMLQEKTGAFIYNCGFGGCRMELLDNADDVAGTNPFAMCSLVDSILSGDWSAQEASPLYSNENVKASLNLLKTIDFSEIDIVLIAYGTNEAGYPQDDTENPLNLNTYAGATRYSLETLMGEYNKLGVMLLTPIYRYSWGDGDTRDSDTHTHPVYGNKLTDNVETLKEVAQEYKVPCIDMYYQLGINKVNRDVYYIDGTHLNYVGLQRYSGFVAQGVEKYQ